MAILYYSKSSSKCLDFLKQLKTEGMFSLFDEYFCIDNRNLSRYPWLKSVPTIIVPESQEPLVDDDAFAWLSYKLNQKYKKDEIGTLQSADNFVDLNQDPNDIRLDTDSYISINNIDKPLKPQQSSKFSNAESMDVNKRLEALQQERSHFASQQKGSTPMKPKFN